MAELGDASVVRTGVRSFEDLGLPATCAEDAVGGRLDILFVNAGVAHFGPFEELDHSRFR
ncbi:hypothetical protein ABZ896_10690 [Streptomyces sp. NPDC047072]|uniref:hypothetical protein n=1 Tax=Streptomyces sp. NPDC047072 TaxID=3154809 RepID=UPI00340D12D3